MAQKVSRRNSASIKGVLAIEDGKILVEVEDIFPAFVLSEFLKEFDGKDVSLSVTHREDIGREDN